MRISVYSDGTPSVAADGIGGVYLLTKRFKCDIILIERLVNNIMKNPRVKVIIKSWDSAEAIHKTHSFILQDWQHKNYWTLVDCGASTKRLLENIAYSEHLNCYEEIVQIDIKYLQTEVES